ncbi:MAG: TIR domain-containing protein [Pseudobutyrivibrio sp.]|nr:TIR domain-containing protein [Pseudobutyrivibrio sp.]
MKYDAFISYRHLPKDMYVAKRVHRALETVKIPKKIQQETGRKKINRVFRDQEELPIGSDLGSNIETALREAAFLVVICSPQTKESYWVNKEIDTFIAMHGRQNVLAVLVEGSPRDSFPPQLRVDENGERVEPLAADVRANSNREINKKLKTETLRLAASILHVDFDDLKQRHRERQMRRNVSIAAGVAALGIAFGIYNAYNLAKINEEYQQKLINESKVMAATSLDVYDSGDRKTAALIAMDALPSEENDRPFVSDAQYALTTALGTYDPGNTVSYKWLLKHHVNVNGFATDLENNRLLSYDNNNTVYLWDLTTGDLLFEKITDIVDGSEASVKTVGFCNGNAVVCTDQNARAYDDNGDVVYEIVPDSFSLIRGTVDKNKNYIQLYGCSYDDSFNRKNVVEVYDAKTGEFYKRYEFDEADEIGSGAIFSPDGRYMVLDLPARVSSTDVGQQYYTLIDMETDNITRIPATKDSSLDLNFTGDNQFSAVSMTADSLFGFENTQIYVQTFDVTTGAELWSQTLDYTNAALNTSYTHIKSRVVTDDSGEELHLTHVSSGKNMYTLNSDTGEIVSKIVTNDWIENYLSTDANTTLFVGTADGLVTPYDAITGEAFNDYVDKTSSSLIDMDGGKGYLISQGYRSPNITVMSYTDSDALLSSTEMEERYDTVAVSPDESTYVVSAKADSNATTNSFYVFDAKTSEMTTEFKVDNAELYKVAYADNDTIVVPGKDGNLNLYSIKNEKLDTEKLLDENYCNSKFSADNSKLFMYYEGKYVVYDLVNKKLLHQDESDERINIVDLSDDATKAFCVNSKGHVSEITLSDGSCTNLFKEYTVKNLELSADGSLCAIVCSDGYLRVFDTETQEILHEIEYYGSSNTYEEFSSDNKLLYLQGSDLYFKIYDLETKKFLYVSDNQINDISRTTYDADNNYLAIYSYYDMYIIDLNDFGILASMDYGKLYLPKNQQLVYIKYYDLMTFKFKSFSELMEDAKNTFGDAQLSTEEKLKYRIN